VFIGHSIGGLVIEKACTLAQQDSLFQSTRKRIQAIFFLGTPHRGASLSQTLTYIIRASGAKKQGICCRCTHQSAFLQSINEDSRHCIEGIQLTSLYESKPINIIAGSEIIVPQDSATLGYPQEGTACLTQITKAWQSLAMLRSLSLSHSEKLF
jgi:hypothetical protein